MPRILTLSGRSSFECTLDGNGGFFLEYTGRPHIKAELVRRIQTVFRNRTVPGGFNMTDPMPGGFGEWIQNNSPFTPRHASHIAAVLKDLGIIKESSGLKPIMLRF